MNRKLIAILSCALTIVGIIAAFAGQHQAFVSQAFATTSGCENGGALTYDEAVDEIASGGLVIARDPDVVSNQVSVTVTNNTLCPVSISLSSYKMFGPYSLSTQSQQTFFDGTPTTNVDPSASVTLNVNLPACASQYDIWYGDAPHTLTDNQPYGTLLAGDQLNQNNFCANLPPPTPITATLTADSSCVVPGTNINFTATAAGDNITSKTLEKDTNGDGVFGQVASFGAGPGTNTFTSAEAASYSGTYTLRFMVNGIEMASKSVTVGASCAPVVVPSAPIVGSLTADSSCVVPGTNINFTANVTGDGITSKTLEKDTNADGVYGQVASFGGGPGTGTYTTNESPTYSGTYSMKLLVNGTEVARKDVTVNTSCAPVTVVPSVPITATLTADSSCVVPGTNINFTATAAGDNITSKTLEKDTNGDGVFGQVASFGSGPGTGTYTTNESPTYSGTYTLRFMVNGSEMARQNVTVGASCAPVVVTPPVIPPVIPPVVVPTTTPTTTPVVPVVTATTTPPVVTATTTPTVPSPVVDTTPPPSGVIVSSGGGGPNINITKSADPTSLPDGPGLVTYTYTVWNGATELDLTDVSVNDDKCGPPTFISGDNNNNSKLDPGERWIYSCTMRLTQTTTNTAIAVGYSDNPSHQSVTATAVATVPVGAPATVQALAPTTPAAVEAETAITPVYPGFPNTGFPPLGSE